jgi:hypothetical protein
MRNLILLSLVALGACGTANRTDGVTPAEAAQLNAAADKLDAQQANATR